MKQRNRWSSPAVETSASSSLPRKVIHQWPSAPSHGEVKTKPKTSNSRCISQWQCPGPSWVHHHLELPDHAKARPAQSTLHWEFRQTCGWNPISWTQLDHPWQWDPYSRGSLATQRPWRGLKRRHLCLDMAPAVALPRQVHLDPHLGSHPTLHHVHAGHQPSVHVIQWPAEQQQWIPSASGHAGGWAWCCPKPVR